MIRWCTYDPCRCGLCQMRRADERRRGKRTVENGRRLIQVLGWYRADA